MKDLNLQLIGNLYLPLSGNHMHLDRVDRVPWLFSSLRLYYAVRDWSWYKFYTMVKGEMGKILAKMAEDARKKAMAEGLSKVQVNVLK